MLSEKEKAKALKEKEKARALKEKAKAKALKEKAKARELKAKAKARELKEKAKVKARALTQKALKRKHINGGEDQEKKKYNGTYITSVHPDIAGPLPGTRVDFYIYTTEQIIKEEFHDSLSDIDEDRLYEIANRHFIKVNVL